MDFHHEVIAQETLFLLEKYEQGKNCFGYFEGWLSTGLYGYNPTDRKWLAQAIHNNVKLHLHDKAYVGKMELYEKGSVFIYVKTRPCSCTIM
jgi:hypothetical protein